MNDINRMKWMFSGDFRPEAEHRCKALSELHGRDKSHNCAVMLFNGCGYLLEEAYEGRGQVLHAGAVQVANCPFCGERL